MFAPAAVRVLIDDRLALGGGIGDLLAFASLRELEAVDLLDRDRGELHLREPRQQVRFESPFDVCPPRLAQSGAAGRAAAERRAGSSPLALRAASVSG